MFALVSMALALMRLTLLPSPDYTCPTPWGRVEVYSWDSAAGWGFGRTQIRFVETGESWNIPLPLWGVIVVSILILLAVIGMTGYAAHSISQKINRSRESSSP